jgi:hypothetical protein
MSTRALTIIDTERADGFRNLAGTRLEATLPVTQHLVDIEIAHAGSRRNLHGLQVTLRAGNEIGVEVVKPVFGFNARLALVFRIAGPVDVASDPRVYLLVNPSLTWTAVSRLATAAGLAPAGVSIGRDGVAVDLRALAARAGLDDLLSLARTLELEGRAGVLIVRIAIEVPEGGVTGRTTQGPDRESVPQAGGAGARTGPLESGDESGRPGPRAVETLLRELEGARVRGRVSVGEGLANAAIGAALQSAREAAAGERGADAGGAPADAAPSAVDGSTLTRWVQRAHVQFVNGRMVLDVDIVLT